MPWPLLSTVSDAAPAWSALPEIAVELDEIRDASPWKPSPISDMLPATIPPYVALRGVVRDLLSARDVRPVVEPITRHPRAVDLVRAFWSNRYGVDELRRSARGGDRSSRSRARLRDLAEHTNHVLFPEVAALWSGYGDVYDDAVRYRDEHPIARPPAVAFARVPVTLRGTASLGPSDPIPNE